MLPGTDLAGASQLAERVRTALEQRTILAPDGTRIRVTVSLGVAAFPEAGTASIVAAADGRSTRQSGRERTGSMTAASEEATPEKSLETPPEAAKIRAPDLSPTRRNYAGRDPVVICTGDPGPPRAEGANSELESRDAARPVQDQDPFENHPLFKTEEQARLEETMDGEEPAIVRRLGQSDGLA